MSPLCELSSTVFGAHAVVTLTGPDTVLAASVKPQKASTETAPEPVWICALPRNPDSRTAPPRVRTVTATPSGTSTRYDAAHEPITTFGHVDVTCSTPPASERRSTGVRPNAARSLRLIRTFAGP